MNILDLQRRGLLCVVSGPSGSGKTTLCRRFSDEDKGATYAISATTRDPRAGEENGIDYYFMTREEFETKASQGEFLEYAEVHGNLYGTLKSEVIRHISEGRDVLMDLDVQGAALIRKQADTRIQEAFVDVFILLPGDEELLKRLGVRGTESEEQVKLRLQNAHEEIRHWRDYRYTIISEDKETDFATFGAIINGERRRSTRLKKGTGNDQAGE
ncbi:guanylate kinase [Verrucomicrobiales bacterium BCK34]|nr:guanylate kinase [Verrucomicrobiales bacterium BCK34]